LAHSNEYTIPFAGLKLGKHKFTFEIGASFFEHFDNSEIHNCSLLVETDLDRQNNALVFDFDIKGTVDTLCDRCQDPMILELDYQDRLLVRFGDATSSFEEEIITLGPQEFEIDLSHFIYEFCHLAIPSRHVHQSSEECNQDIIRFLNEMPEDENTDTDPRWDSLKNLKG